MLKTTFAKTLVLLALAGAGWTQSLQAHGDDLRLIEALTEELDKVPDADLFIRRGELFRHHQEWAKAEADLIAAAKLDPELAIVDYFLARVLLESGAPQKAEPFLERYLETAPNEPEAWYLRGEIAAALGQIEAAAAHYAGGIERAPNPRPEHYLRRARILASAAKPDTVRVLAALDEGIARLGPVISLVEYAITLDLDLANYDGALARIARAMESMPRRERWLVRQGDILVKSGRTREAIASYRAALNAIEGLPERYRDTVPMEKLASDVRKSLERLSAK